jgi:D-glycero-D-manno-heptose 1,7-bisphosphate phosphatase
MMEGLILPQGIWVSRTPATTPKGGHGLILDRDGVVVEEKHYLHKPEDVVLMPGIAGLIGAARRAGMAVAVVTNQSGIDRGYFGWAQFLAVEQRIAALLAEQGVALDLRIACPFHPDFTPGYGEAQEYWRKPGPGMIDFALKSLVLEPSASVMVGDKVADVAAALAAGLAGAYFVRGPYHDQADAALALATSSFFVTAVDSLPGISADFGLGRVGRRE